MAEVKWIKICTDIFDDEKIILIESMPDSYAIITAWFKLLCLAGKQNNSGVFMLNDRIAYTEEMLATIFRMPLNTVRLALDTFERFGMIETINGVITIPNWEKHQTLEKIQSHNEYMKNYMRDRREKQKQIAENSSVNNNVNNSKLTVNAADKDIDKDKDKENIYIGLSDPVVDAIKEFEKMRKRQKKELTQGATKRLIAKLKTFPEEQWVDVINQSIDNCWLSFYPLKGEKNDSRTAFSNGKESTGKFDFLDPD